MKRLLVILALVFSNTVFAAVDEDKLIANAKMWASTIPNPTGLKGNCLPVAAKLQDYLVRNGHMAMIVGVRDDNGGHALVMYNSKGGRFDTLIDNGYMTKYRLISRDKLYDGSLGSYLGICSKTEVNKGSCSLGRAF